MRMEFIRLAFGVGGFNSNRFNQTNMTEQDKVLVFYP